METEGRGGESGVLRGTEGDRGAQRGPQGNILRRCTRNFQLQFNAGK